MGEILNDILMFSQKDVKRLLQMKDWLKHSSEAEIKSPLMREIMEGFNRVASTVNSFDKPEWEYFAIILDVLLCVFKIKRNQEVLNKLGIEFGNLTIKILTGIEKTDNFFLLFSKFLSLINLVCCNVNVCRLLPRPLFNIFINKEFELTNFQKAIQEFKIICKKFERKEILNFTIENLDILRGFSMLTRRIGDIIIQTDIVELILLYVDNDKNLINGFFTYGNRGVSEILTKLDFSDTARDSRLFLNVLNESLIFGKKVYSINCHLFYVGNAGLLPPSRMDAIWADVNKDSKRITIFCDNFYSSKESSIFLELPLSHVQKIDVEFSSIYGEECYWITMKIFKISQIFPFAKGSSIICASLACKNSSRSIFDFVSQAEKLSEKIRDSHKKFQLSFDTFLKMKHSESPRDNEIILKCKNFTSTTSPLLLITREKDDKKLSSQVSERERKELPKFFNNQKLQVNKISTSIFEGKHGNKIRNEEVVEKPVELRFDPKFLDNSFDEVDRVDCSGTSNESEDEENKIGFYSRRLFQGSASSNEDLFFTPENEKLIWNFPRESPEKNRPGQSRKSGYYQPEEKEIRKASLLDPDGYSFKLWQSETISERGNFWLKKLEKSDNKNSKGVKDVFQFSEDDSDEPNLEEKETVKKIRFRNNKKGKLKKGNPGVWENVEILNLPMEKQNLTRKTENNPSSFFQEGFSERENQNLMPVEAVTEEIYRDEMKIHSKNSNLEEKTINIQGKLMEIVGHVSHEMDHFLNKLRKWEGKEIFKYLQIAQESIQRLTEIEEQWLITRKNLEKFINEENSIGENEKVFKHFKSSLDKIKTNKNNKKKLLRAMEKNILLKIEKLINEKFKHFKIELIDH